MKIKHKLLLTFGTLIILSFVIVAINYFTYQTMESDANFVNEAGKLRATGYRMAQLSNIISANADIQKATELENTIFMFDEILQDITLGNPSKGLSALSHDKTSVQLKSIINEWQTVYKPAFVNVKDSGDIESLKVINETIAPYVTAINEMVTGYSAYSSSKVTSAKVTNGILSFVALVFGVISFLFLNKGIRKPINNLIVELKALSEGNGDLTKRIEVKGKDEIAEMTGHFNQFLDDIHKIVIDISKISTVLSSNMSAISNTTEELTKSTEMIAVSSMDVAEGSVTQNHKLDGLNELVKKLKNDIEDVAQRAKQTLRSSEMSQESVVVGNEQVDIQSNELIEFVSSINEASNSVEDLNQSSVEIKAIVELIQSISSQTNLLALNASIEAARAGEAGRGFAVVAEEIRKLAEETAESAKKISGIVSSISHKTIAVKESMDGLVEKTKVQEASMGTLKKELKKILDRTALTLGKSQDILNISSKVNEDFTEITTSTKEIQGIAEQNSGNTQDVASAVEEQTASFEEVSANIGLINEMAGKLTQIVGKFRI